MPRSRSYSRAWALRPVAPGQAGPATGLKGMDWWASVFSSLGANQGETGQVLAGGAPLGSPASLTFAPSALWIPSVPALRAPSTTIPVTLGGSDSLHLGKREGWEKVTAVSEGQRHSEAKLVHPIFREKKTGSGRPCDSASDATETRKGKQARGGGQRGPQSRLPTWEPTALDRSEPGGAAGGKGCVHQARLRVRLFSQPPAEGKRTGLECPLAGMARGLGGHCPVDTSQCCQFQGGCLRWAVWVLGV